MQNQSAVSVFLSSTCYDLVDLRAELAAGLHRESFIVRLSDDPNSPFAVDATDNSIASCLRNVESSDALVCVIDRRYGPPLGAKFDHVSATHAEVRHARSLGKKLFFFIRRRAYQEFDLMKAAGWAAKTRWVEPDEGGVANPSRERWYNFVKEVIALPRSEDWSNWCDQFDTSIDLKQIVLKRLLGAFERQVAVKAMQPDRIVRLTLMHESDWLRGFMASIENVGVGPAFDITTGFREGQAFETNGVKGGLGVGKTMDEWGFALNHVAVGTAMTAFVKYRNAFGDWYRVERRIGWHKDSGYMTGGDMLFVGNDSVPEHEWIRVV